MRKMSKRTRKDPSVYALAEYWQLVTRCESATPKAPWLLSDRLVSDGIAPPAPQQPAVDEQVDQHYDGSQHVLNRSAQPGRIDQWQQCSMKPAR